MEVIGESSFSGVPIGDKRVVDIPTKECCECFVDLRKFAPERDHGVYPSRKRASYT